MWTQCKYPSTVEWINCTLVYKIENILAMKQELTSQIKMLSERSQTQSNTCVMIPFYIKCPNGENYYGTRNQERG